MTAALAAVEAMSVKMEESVKAMTTQHAEHDANTASAIASLATETKEALADLASKQEAHDKRTAANIEAAAVKSHGATTELSQMLSQFIAHSHSLRMQGPSAQTIELFHEKWSAVERVVTGTGLHTWLPTLRAARDCWWAHAHLPLTPHPKELSLPAPAPHQHKRADDVSEQRDRDTQEGGARDTGGRGGGGARWIGVGRRARQNRLGTRQMRARQL